MSNKRHSSTELQKIKTLLQRGVEEIIERDHLEALLRSGKKLRVKFGIDPTAPDLHVGHSVVLRKLRQFQDLGHKVIFLVGDFTAKIGDPSGRSETRPLLSDQEIRANTKTFARQAGALLDMKRVEVRFNSEWYAKKKPDFFLDLFAKVTVDRILERDDFQKRMQAGQGISMLEMVYPLLQGYDSVALAADVEVGGTDQKFNMLMGRRIQRRFGLAEQDIITVPLLEGLDGKQKMSKSYGNYVALTDAPEDMYGKIMSVPDELIERYFLLCTDVTERDIAKIMREGPRSAKARLAHELVSRYHGAHSADKTQTAFDRQFREGIVPEDIPSFKITSRDPTIIDVLAHARLASSKSEARRLVAQGGVWVYRRDKKMRIEHAEARAGDYAGCVIQVGKRRFVKILPQ